jgi:hypothetical protein
VPDTNLVKKPYPNRRKKSKSRNWKLLKKLWRTVSMVLGGLSWVGSVDETRRRLKRVMSCS